MKRHCKLKITILFVVFIICLIITAPNYFPALLLSVVIHELGHIVAAKLCGIHLSELRLGIFGATIVPSSSSYSYGEEIILCLGGPLFNFISVALAIGMLSLSPMCYFVLSSIALGTLNLLPVSGFDGGRIAGAFLHMLLPDKTANAIIKILSFIILFSLWSISLYLLLRVGATLSLFVFCLSVFVKIFIPD